MTPAHKVEKYKLRHTEAETDLQSLLPSKLLSSYFFSRLEASRLQVFRLALSQDVQSKLTSLQAAATALETPPALSHQTSRVLSPYISSEGKMVDTETSAAKPKQANRLSSVVPDTPDSTAVELSSTEHTLFTGGAASALSVSAPAGSHMINFVSESAAVSKIRGLFPKSPSGICCLIHKPLSIPNTWT